MIKSFYSKVWWEVGICLMLLLLYKLLAEGCSVSLEMGEWVGGLVGEEISFFIDCKSFIFLFMVLIVSLSVTKYSFFYIEKENVGKFLCLLSFFIFSMILLCMSSNLIWSLVGWDGLGITSLFLILFYSNWSSSSGGLTTFLLNRLGDIFLLSSIILLSMSKGSLWCVGFKEDEVFGFMLVVGVLAKSAQFPYSSWLPLAMAAPTPVSSLVHSSTLVTAGIYMVVRNFSFLTENCLFFMKGMAFSTILYAGFSALVELDLKKVIAYSTLSHLSMMIFLISLKKLGAAMCHMFTHALFKSLLFMVAGVILHEMKGKQDSRSISLSLSSSPLLSSLFCSSVVSMVGIPFMSGFFSKEMSVWSSFENFNSSWNILSLAVSACLSTAYSFRLLFFLSMGSPIPFKSKNFSLESEKMSKCLSFSFLVNLISGTLILPLLYEGPSFPLPEGASALKFFIVLAIILGLFLGSVSSFLFKELTSWAILSQSKVALLDLSLSLSWAGSLRKLSLWFPMVESFGSMEKFTRSLFPLTLSLSEGFWFKIEGEIAPAVKLTSCLSVLIILIYVCSLSFFKALLWSGK